MIAELQKKMFPKSDVAHLLGEHEETRVKPEMLVSTPCDLSDVYRS